MGRICWAHAHDVDLSPKTPFHPGTRVWPSWRDSSVLSPFADPTSNMTMLGSATPADYYNPHNSSVKTLSKASENEVTTHEGSKKTL